MGDAGGLLDEITHPALLIPGPVDFDKAVLKAMSSDAEFHLGTSFVNVFGEVLSMLRRFFQTTNPESQPFVLSGSGTLGWDLVAANLVEAGEHVLILHTGYFADCFKECCDNYEINVTEIKAPIGHRPQLDEIEAALWERPYKIIQLTHVDTSTGVRIPLQPLVQLVRRVFPSTLVVVDGVCSVGCEEIAFDDWDLDVVMSATQKAVGCPAGLSIMMCSSRAMKVFDSRRSKPPSYYANLAKWLPVMRTYEARRLGYFATERFNQHAQASAKVKQAVGEMGLQQIAQDPEDQAHALTAMYLPEGLAPIDILPRLLQRGVILAGGLHKDLLTRCIRFGHMGVCVTHEQRDDIDRGIAALRVVLDEVMREKGQVGAHSS
ncbi:hypothetical protein M409DRAFT_69787 [Zasmidium cellare ATCC 36951]|uniref:alanine--glyoxylate transaminase n=1 Tax=Zasmidium cellare ATCC 36951 TaxID=1080233 RepID=A0A6A6C5H3_ZASCE|nr:uncharacterized protein M409DRAFT_69787 [Zasmidium cellare ATCC 36951]KAF2161440.1 hypothetical protein M409DRAFT_69787 [Zasmidium cellare ATCC 36951]